jgi:transposase
LAYFVSDVVDQLDLSAIESVYDEDDRGQPSYHPRKMTKVLLYGYCVGVFSSRKLQKRLVEDVAFRVLAAGNQLDPGEFSEEASGNTGKAIPTSVAADVRDRNGPVL